jgi:predicted O-methyltransferase YrrM
MLTGALIALNVVLLAFAISMAVNVRRLRQVKRETRGAWEVPQVRVDQLDPAFAPDNLGPTPAAEVRFIGAGNLPVTGGTSDFEAWILAVLARRAHVMFEFGTGTGRTAYLCARNMPVDGIVYTISLAPEQHHRYDHAEGDNDLAARRAREESAFTRFRYSGTDVERRVVQLFGDSKALDDTPYRGRCDLVFVDGSHAYSYVKSDTERALRMVKPGGIVLWHDYRGPRLVPDVHRALNELARELPLVHIAETALVAYRRP